MKLNKKKIQKEIKRQGISQNSFARQLNYTPQGFSLMLKNGKTSFDNLSKIAKALDLDEKDLVI